MFKFINLFFILISFSALGARDKYANFAELSLFEKAGKDFRIVLKSGSKKLSVFAIHGGKIEPGSSELAQAIAGNKASYYAFEGLKESDNFSLHLTSTQFDEPQALELAAKSEQCLSVHSYISRRGEKAICVGGKNQFAAEKLANHLRSKVAGLEIHYPCVLFPGTHAKNIVNRCEKHGVQLEISTMAMDKLLADHALKSSLVREIRQAFSLDEAPPETL